MANPEMDLVITDLAKRTENDLTSLSAVFALDGGKYTVWYRSAQGGLADYGDPFFIAGALPAMKRGATLRSAYPVSRRLHAALPAIQEIFHTWEPAFQPIVLDVPVETRERPASVTRAGAFFSGGVDSFYTLIKHQDEITDLILVHGFDVPLGDVVLWSTVSSRMREVAARFGKRLIEVETNLQDFSGRYVTWDLYFGSALASVAALLSPLFARIYVPSSHTYAQIIPNGSHPLVDPLWSTESLEIVHDGCEASRIDKVRRLASSEVALNHLRVCWENKDGHYNCGRCEKCVRTMVALQIAGVLERCPTFAHPLQLRSVARIRTDDAHARAFVEENLRAAELGGADPALTRALHDSLSGRFYHRGWRLTEAAARLPWSLFRAVVPAGVRGVLRRRWERLRTRSGSATRPAVRRGVGEP